MEIWEIEEIGCELSDVLSEIGMSVKERQRVDAKICKLMGELRDAHAKMEQMQYKLDELRECERQLYG